MNDLRISDDLSLPAEAVTQTFGVLAKRGVGKSYTASVLSEELLKAGLPVVIVDPLDVWWGLRASADGTGPGLPIAVLGGSHGDLPLEATAGAIIADLIVEESLSAVLSLRHLSKTEQRRFVTDFCERLYHRKGEDRYRQPLHVIIDEADAYVPQRVAAGQERMVGAVDDLVRRGRASGLGVTLITQRAAVIHKDVLTQIEVLIALRTVSPQDRKALEAWIEAHDAHDQRREFMASLASLEIGEAWVWSPGWLDVFKRVRIRRRETYDSSATPKIGQQLKPPKRLAAVDLEVLRERLASTIERAKADDPRELRHRIAELEKQLRTRPTETKVEQVVERVEVSVLDEHQVGQLTEATDGLRSTAMRLIDVADGLATALLRARPTLNSGSQSQSTAPVRTVRTPPEPARPRSKAPSPPGVAATVQLRAGERKMLQVLASRHPGVVTRAQLATLARFKVTGGTFSAYFSTLKRAGLLQESSGEIRITPVGLDYIGADVPSPQTTDELLEMWRGALRAGERAMLDELVDAYPDALSREALAERTGFTVSGGTFSTYLGVLRRNGLADVDGAAVRASDTLFLMERTGS